MGELSQAFNYTYGYWMKTLPTMPGLFWIADQEGNLVGVRHLILENEKLKDENPEPWDGWYWSVPIPEPPEPPLWDDKDPYQFGRKVQASMKIRALQLRLEGDEGDGTKLKMIRVIRQEYGVDIRVAKELVEDVMKMTPMDILMLRKKDGA